MFGFKYLFIDVMENLFDGILDYFVDEVTKSTIGRSFMISLDSIRSILLLMPVTVPTIIIFSVSRTEWKNT